MSYNRPFDGGSTPTAAPRTSTTPSIRWCAGWRRTATTSATRATRSSTAPRCLINNHKIFISSGHDEYWSRASAYQNLKAARDAGVNLAFFSGNEMFWKTRWANSSDGTNTPYRTLITYKETHFNAPTDPRTRHLDGRWGDPRFSPPADGGGPQTP